MPTFYVWLILIPMEWMFACFDAAIKIVLFICISRFINENTDVNKTIISKHVFCVEDIIDNCMLLLLMVLVLSFEFHDMLLLPIVAAKSTSTTCILI